ncbi:MAG: cyanophycin synthetase, partial [Deltaproteobacteria bacterium]
VCSEKGAPLYRLGRDFSFQRKGTVKFSYNGISEGFEDLTLNLTGSHQFSNASIAIASVELLRKKGFAVSKEAIYRGLADVAWPGRLETVSEKPMVILDGAHNPAGAEALAGVIADELEFDKLYLILGIMADKDIDGIISPLAPLAYEVILSRPEYERASPASALLPMAKKYNSNSTALESLKEAIAYARSRAAGDDLIIISGSLFTVGEARAFLTSKR